MKISEFIKKLKEYKKERGDLEMLFSVRDHYCAAYGYDAQHEIGDSFWDGTFKSGGFVRFNIHLESYKEFNGENKYPLVTFRKSRH